MVKIKSIRWLVLIILIVAIISLLNWLLPSQRQSAQPALNKAQPVSQPNRTIDKPTTESKHSSVDKSSKSHTQELAKRPVLQHSAASIKQLQKIESMQGHVTDLANEFDYHHADDTSKFAYLAAIANCTHFIQYATQGHLQITPQSTPTDSNTSASPTTLKQIKNCHGAAVSLIKPIYAMLEQLALTTANPEVSIQANLLLSHLPNINTVKTDKHSIKSTNDAIAHAQKQLMWLENARQQGSLQALLTLAIRYQYGDTPDPVAATSYYLTLQKIAPEYQLSSQVKNLTDNLKTWQLTQAQQNSELYLNQMKQLKTLYKW